MSEIIVAIITGAFGLVGSVIVAFIGASVTRSTITHKLDKAQAVTDTKLEELTREVREHNNFARRMPVVEEQIKVVNHRIDDLERKAES